MTDKEKILKAINQKQQEIWPTDTGEMAPATVPFAVVQGWLNALKWMEDFINSFPAEQPNENLEYLATSLEETIGTSPHSREAILDHLKQAANWQKEQTINKASKWLADNVINYIWCSEGNLGIGDEFFIDFEKAMNI